jgi:hypothetical protein
MALSIDGWSGVLTADMSLKLGEIVVSGTGQELLNDPKVQAAYLGWRVPEQEKLQKAIITSMLPNEANLG